MKFKIILLFFASIVLYSPLLCKEYDLTVVGVADDKDSFGKITLGIIEQLKGNVRINHTYRYPPTLEGVSKGARAILRGKDKSAGRVSLLTTPLWFAGLDDSKLVPRQSLIKIAYSMTECSCPPKQWVEILNQRFDAVVVPDPFLVDAYRTAGVAIPIFCIPIGMDLEPFFQEPERKSAHFPFVFGSTVALTERKNHPLLIQAFLEEFSSGENVILKMNGRTYPTERAYLTGLENLVQSLSTVFLSTHRFDRRAYREFMRSFDCFVNISLGEGFSLCPREALAFGMPCILSDNTAQKTLCDTGLVRAVPANCAVPTDYNGLFGDQIIGDQYECELQDVRAALRDVYENYSYYLQKAQEGREWVKRYCWENLKARFLNVVKPKEVILGARNEVTATYLMTDSQALYDKYLIIEAQ